MAPNHSTVSLADANPAEEPDDPLNQLRCVATGWLDEMIRLLKPGGSLFLWNLPKWNLPLGAHLGRHLTFRHWIAVDIKYTLPIPKRLYPSHYSLLYFVKGERPTIFHPDRIPTPCCRHCGGELRDYVGYKDKMNRGESICLMCGRTSPLSGTSAISGGRQTRFR